MPGVGPVSYESLIVERDGAVGIVTLNRPAVLNTLSLQLSRELDAAVSQLEGDPDIDAIIFTGAGDTAFSAGADVDEISERSTDGDQPTEAEEEEQRYGWRIANCSNNDRTMIRRIKSLLTKGIGSEWRAMYESEVGAKERR